MNVISKQRVDALASVAAGVFLSRGIEEATIKEIATKSGIGEATLYRRYKTKAQLAILAAGYLQKDVLASYFAQDVEGSGFEGLKAFYNVFKEVYENRPEYYRFLDEFDVFVASYPNEAKSGYETGIDQFKSIYLSLYEKGLQDGSIRALEDPESFYFATTHATLSLCKKLSSQSVLAQDYRIDKSKELSVFIETVLYRLDNKQ